MKKAILLISAVVLIGCTYEGEKLSTYLQHPRTFIKDPHFANYKDKRDDLESQYLKKELTYAEYVEKMDELDETYSKEVQERGAIVNPSY